MNPLAKAAVPKAMPYEPRGLNELKIGAVNAENLKLHSPMVRTSNVSTESEERGTKSKIYRLYYSKK